jgi:hypothetical protein
VIAASHRTPRAAPERRAQRSNAASAIRRT